MWPSSYLLIPSKTTQNGKDQEQHNYSISFRWNLIFILLLVNFHNLIIFLYGRIVINLLYNKVNVLTSIHSKRASLPDLPLTPREKEILDKTGEIGVYDNPNFPASRSQDSICSLRREPPDLGELPPPPKPPLPKDPQVIRR